MNNNSEPALSYQDLARTIEREGKRTRLTVCLATTCIIATMLLPGLSLLLLALFVVLFLFYLLVEFFVNKQAKKRIASLYTENQSRTQGG